MGDRILTEEERHKLIGLAPFSTEATIEYMPEPFKKVDASLQPIFILRGFSIEEKRLATKAVNESMKDWTIEKDDKVKDVMRKCIVGWKNLFDVGNGKEIEFTVESASDSGASKKLFASLPSPVVADLLLFLIKISGLVDAEKMGLK